MWKTPLILFAKTTMSEAVASKRTCFRIATHNGKFHCDEVLACFMLKQLPTFQDADIVRTRDSSVIEQSDIVVDVGGVYDHTKFKYDHHQRTFNENMNSLDSRKPWTTKLSSAGLVYFHHGLNVVAKQLQTKPDDDITTIIYNKVYENFVEEIDGIDNGIDQAEGKARYSISTNISSRVSHFNPKWNEDQSEKAETEGFYKAMKMVGEEFLDRINFYHSTWWPARELVEAALLKRFEVDESGEIVVFESGGCPWKDHLFTLEEEKKLNSTIKFVLYSDQNGNWRVQCVSLEKNSFQNRLSLLEEWRGLRDEELSQKSGIPSCVFVHTSGFIGGNKTYSGALEMAKRTLKGI